MKDFGGRVLSGINDKGFINGSLDAIKNGRSWQEVGQDTLRSAIQTLAQEDKSKDNESDYRENTYKAPNQLQSLPKDQYSFSGGSVNPEQWSIYNSYSATPKYMMQSNKVKGTVYRQPDIQPTSRQNQINDQASASLSQQ